MNGDSTQETSPPLEEVGEPSQSLHLDDLPDDVLLMVFERLDVKSRVRIERVSQRWQQLALQLWRSQRNLSLVDVFSRCPEMGGGCLTTCILESLLLRCDGCVRTLNLSYVSRFLGYETGAVISVLCPNLEHLDISGVTLNNTAVQVLGEGCPKLKAAILGKCTEVDDAGIGKLLGLCKNLELLNLVAMHRLTGECFSEAGAGLRRLLLDGCWGITMGGLTTIASKCTSLVELSLSRCIQATDREVELICKNLTQLKTFKLSGSYPGCTSASIDAIAKLSLLEDLDLSHNRHVTDLAMATICKSCRKLSTLDLTGCPSRTTNAILVHLAACSSLRTLRINHSWVTDVGLINLAPQGQLRIMEVRDCPTVTNEGVQALVKQCPHLHLFDLSGCSLVDNKAIVECKKIVRERPHVVTLAVGGTRVRPSRLKLDPKGKLKLETRTVSRGYSEPDGWSNLMFYDHHLHDMGYWDDAWEEYEGIEEDVWDLDSDGDDPEADLEEEAALDGEGALAAQVLPVDVPHEGGGAEEDWPPSDDDDWPYEGGDVWPFDYYDFGEPDEEAWHQNYYDYDFDDDIDDDDIDDDDLLDQDDDLGIGGLFHDPQEDEAPGCAGVADIDHPQDPAPSVAHRPGDPQKKRHEGGAQAENHNPQEEEEEEDRLQDGVDVADFMDDPQEEEQDGYQAGVEIADFMGDPREELWASEGLEYEDFLDDPREEDWD